jgi:cell division initiation protein
MDVERQEFSRRLRGFDVDEVRLFLQSVSEEIQRLHLENGKLLEDAGQLRQEVEALRSRERLLQQTLISAQRLAEELKEKARGERELLLQEARLEAEEILRQAREQRASLEGEISRAVLERETLESRLRSVIQQHLTLLDTQRQERVEPGHLRVLSRRTLSDAG